MGCDIHMYQEKLNDNGEWESTEEWFDEDDDFVPDTGGHISRDYLLFGILTAGQVRYSVEGDYLFPCRDLPTDCDERISVLHTQWDCDAHSTSYLTVAELQYIATELGKHVVLGLSECPPRGVTVIKELIATLPQENPDHHRIVFWFDN